MNVDTTAVSLGALDGVRMRAERNLRQRLSWKLLAAIRYSRFVLRCTCSLFEMQRQTPCVYSDAKVIKQQCHTVAAVMILQGTQKQASLPFCYT